MDRWKESTDRTNKKAYEGIFKSPKAFEISKRQNENAVLTAFYKKENKKHIYILEEIKNGKNQT